MSRLNVFLLRRGGGEIPNFTGISSPYEPPENPEHHIKTAERSLATVIEQLLHDLDLE